MGKVGIELVIFLMLIALTIFYLVLNSKKISAVLGLISALYLIFYALNGLIQGN